MRDPVDLSALIGELDVLEAETFEVKDYADTIDDLPAVPSCTSTSSS